MCARSLGLSQGLTAALVAVCKISSDFTEPQPAAQALSLSVFYWASRRPTETSEAIAMPINQTAGGNGTAVSSTVNIASVFSVRAMSPPRPKVAATRLFTIEMSIVSFKVLRNC